MNNSLEAEVLEILDFIDDYRSIAEDDESNRDQRYSAYDKVSEYQDKLEQLVRSNFDEIFSPELGLRGFVVIEKETGKDITWRDLLYEQWFLSADGILMCGDPEDIIREVIQDKYEVKPEYE